MDFTKILKYVLYALAAFLGMLLVNQWQQDYPPVKPVTEQSTGTPTLPKPLSSHTQAVKSPAMPVFASSLPTKKQLRNLSHHPITVKTDVMTVRIDPVGGRIVSATLSKYPISTTNKQPMEILHDGSGLFSAQSGVVTSTGKSLDQVNFRASATHFEMKPGQQQLTVVLQGQTPRGITVIKTLTFKPNDYAVTVNLTLHNQTQQPWQGGFFHRIVRKNVPAAHAYLQRRSYSGGSMSTVQVPYKKLSFAHMAKNTLNQTVQGGWLAMQQPYFVVSWIPQDKSTNQFFSQVSGGDEHGKNGIFTLGFVSEQVDLKHGATATNQSTLYLGPELTSQLVKAAPSLVNTIDYGWLSFISSTIFAAMKIIHAVIGNWGWTIVLVTLLIKLIFFPLSDKSYKSMARMREAQPRIKAMQDRFKDDREKLNKAMMQFYKDEKLNPVGGCLPMLIQIPVFFALYYVLIESVQLRQAPFIFWIHDLSVRDPYFIFPILMGASMYIQQRLSPAPPDPTQAKVMMFMPVIFTAMFLFFPAGLVIYWLTNNLLSVTHQWAVLKTFDAKKDAYQRREKAKKKKAR